MPRVPQTWGAQDVNPQKTGVPVLSATRAPWARAGAVGRAAALAECFQCETGFSLGPSPHVVWTVVAQTKNRPGFVTLGQHPAPPGTFIYGQCVPGGGGAAPPLPKQYVKGALSGHFFYS